MSIDPRRGFTKAERSIVSETEKRLMAVLLHQLVGCLRHWTDPLRHCGPSDRQLLQQFAAERDEDAFAELVRRHGPMVFAVARRILSDAHDAEDVSQAVFVVLARKAASVRWHESIGGWLFPVVHHLAIKVRGDRQRRRMHETRVEPVLVMEPSAERMHELRDAIDEELGRLPEHYRNAIVLCYLEGKTQKEAAEQLGLSPNEVRGRLERGRLLLRERLTRRGLALSAGALAALNGPQLAAATSCMIETTTRAAVHSAASSRTLALATGVLQAMNHVKGKVLFLVALLLGALAVVSVSLPALAVGDDPGRSSTARSEQKGPKPEAKPDARKTPRSLIVLWMNGGPSQIDTFDLKPGDPNGGGAREIDTVVKGIRISEHLPRLAKLTDQMAIIRTMTHDEGSHERARHLMRTGHVVGPGSNFPPLTALLAKELSDGKLNVPPYVAIGGDPEGAGFLSNEFSPLAVRDAGADLGPRVPPVEVFKELHKGRAEAMRKGVEKAFDLGEEKKAVRDAYGRNPFGQGCLLARRLVEAGVPVVEVSLGGWDSHNLNEDIVRRRCGLLDPAWAALLRDLKERKLSDRVLVVWMGEFGRTPRINVNAGRDHWSHGFSVVLAGCGIKGGRIIGQTSTDGTTIDARPVTPAALHATICRALRIDPAKENKSDTGDNVPLVEKGTKEVKEALK
jgi:RNA polymerase sigma factor (sigma-70 family)